MTSHEVIAEVAVLPEEKIIYTYHLNLYYRSYVDLYSFISQLYKLIDYSINIGIEQIICKILFCNLSVFRFLYVIDIFSDRGAS